MAVRPLLNFRVSTETQRRLAEMAQAQERSVSALLRDALAIVLAGEPKKDAAA